MKDLATDNHDSIMQDNVEPVKPFSWEIHSELGMSDSERSTSKTGIDPMCNVCHVILLWHEQACMFSSYANK